MMTGVLFSPQVIGALSRLVHPSKKLINTVQRQFSILSTVNFQTPTGISSSILVKRSASSEVPTYYDNSKFPEPPSPYRKPGPRAFGYETKLHQGGVLPRSDTAKSVALPRYEPRNPWSRKKALFGQNDYIDILGDGDIRPFDLLSGPRWLLGFKGHEMQRIIRQLKFDGPRLNYLYPTEFRNLNKRLRFLYKKYNHKRSHKHR